ncbi:MAG: sulfatase family protein [Calditrichia bacterium]
MIFRMILYLLTVMMSQSLFAQSPIKTPQKPPNIILLIGDDHGYPYFGFMGSKDVYTPNMDLLASEGTVFTEAHVSQNHCRPSLQTLVTGLHPVAYQQQVQAEMEKARTSEDYVRLDADGRKDWERNFDFHAMKYFNTLPKRLAEKGYASFQGGKWWEYNYQNGHFTDGMTTGWTKEERKDGSKWFKRFMGGDGLALSRKTMQPVYDFIDENADKPFFIWYGPELPHVPHNAPYRYLKYYQNKNLSESAKQYYAMCTWFDDGVGSLMDYVHSKGLSGNTIFVYVNDNGWEQPPNVDYTEDNLLKSNGGDKGKLSMYDMSYRTPLVFYWPDKIAAGVIRKDLVSTVDFMPTMLDYLGMDYSDLPGHSLRPVIDKGERGKRDYLVGKANQFRSRDDMMGKKSLAYYYRDADWHFMWFIDEKRVELYDMLQDPNNNNNVAADYSELIENLKVKISDWRREMKDL